MLPVSVSVSLALGPRRIFQSLEVPTSDRNELKEMALHMNSRLKVNSVRELLFLNSEKMPHCKQWKLIN
jgi:hypothetical protein